MKEGELVFRARNYFSCHLEKLPFRPISASQKNEKYSHIINMLRFLIFLFLDLERKF